jgi:hypothetical protein
VIAALLLALAADGDPLPTRMGLETPELRVQAANMDLERGHFGISLSAQARVAIPFGAADRGDTVVAGNVIVIQNRMSYLELFTPGLGFTLEADFMLRPPPPVPWGPGWERTPAMGDHVAFECD